jgi:hypothetical protein
LQQEPQLRLRGRRHEAAALALTFLHQFIVTLGRNNLCFKQSKQLVEYCVQSRLWSMAPALAGGNDVVLAFFLPCHTVRFLSHADLTQAGEAGREGGVML